MHAKTGHVINCQRSTKFVLQVVDKQVHTVRQLADIKPGFHHGNNSRQH